jgi:uncharacterized protein
MRTVAVIGASPSRAKWGNKAVRAFRAQGYIVYPVHPAHDEVEGLPCYKSILDVPGPLDIVSVYVGPERLVELLPAIAEKKCEELWLNPGTESPAVLQTAKKLGLKTVQTCSILAVGVSPASL